jgi:hypothetical protein
MLQAKIEALMNRLEEPAILALRPYPPVNLLDTNSQLGGLPTLPSEASWPRATDDTPLHFLARIDCFELPHTRGPLPEYGILQFFARIDEEMAWEGPAAGYARVLYSEHAAGRATPPPADLPPIMGGWHDYDREMRLPDEPNTRIYPHWPLTFTSIRSWPQLPPIDLSPKSIRSGNPTIEDGGVTLEPYLEAVERARAAEIVRTTGRPTNPLRTPQWGETFTGYDGKRVVRLPGMGFPLLPRGTPAFPQAWILVERIARGFACLANEELGKLPGNKPKEGVDPKQLRADQAADQSLSWVRRALLAGLDAPMGEVDAKAFMDWLTALSSDERWDVVYLVSQALKRGMSSAIKYCGGSRAAAAIVPTGYMNYLEGEHFLTSPDTYGIEVAAPRRRISTRRHQLLGHAPASQGVERKPNDVLLLHLVSDRGVDFMFCDVGEIQFWIDAADLAARRFDAVRANTQGG